MNSKYSKVFYLTAAISLLIIAEIFGQQSISFVRVSQAAKVYQAVGFAEVEINYSRPSANDREIWGTLVPYGLAPNAFGNGNPMPWRMGANENTTISFSHDAKINGSVLPAGKYGMHAIVHEDEWTIIFNKDADAWGSFSYEQSQDALRIKAIPKQEPHNEMLTFGFENVTLNSADIYLHWGKVKVLFAVEFDRHAVTLDTYRKELTGLASFNQAAWGAAARYCLQNNINLDEAMVWIDKALAMNGGNNFNNKSVKAGLLVKNGKTEEGDKLMEGAFENATEAELNVYGYQLMGQGRLDDAINIFKMNIKRYPDSWNVYDSLGEALNNKGDKTGAKEYYEIAYEKAPGLQKERIEVIIKGL
jgi:tetratricopeptide (TPR) repeat protein